MSQPLTFDTSSPRFGLPLLFAGQSQKEVFVNEALALTDALLHCAIEGTASVPPASPAEGDNWLVDAAASGDWLGQDGAIACRQGGNWLFVIPRVGMRVYDRSAGQVRLYDGGWIAPSAPASPSGGTVVDTEARAAIDALVSAIQSAGIFGES
jgi:hypothetical protein